MLRCRKKTNFDMSKTVPNGAHGIHTKAVRISLIFKPEESSVKVQEDQYDKFAGPTNTENEQGLLLLRTPTTRAQ